MTKYRFSEGAAIVFGGSGGLGTGIVNLLAESGSDVAFSYHKNKENGFQFQHRKHPLMFV